jgi:hypothetical protein
MDHRTLIINGLHASPHLQVNPTEKSNPSPDVLPPEARKLWDETFEVAESYYQGAHDLSAMTAWRAVKMEYPYGAGSWRPLSKNPTSPPTVAKPLPPPEQMITLGRCLEYVVLENPPRMDVYRFKNELDAPKLLWSEPQKMLLVLPQDQISEHLNPDMSGLLETRKLYEDYRWGQPARGYTEHGVPAVNVKPLGMADTIVYRSDKGNRSTRDDLPGVQEYIHQFGDGVVAFQGPNVKDPKAVMFQGGNLTVRGPGIID